MHLEEIPIVCISLDRRLDRWAAFKDRAKAAGLRVQRLSAVDAKSFVAHQHPSVSLTTAHNLYYGSRRSSYEIDAPGAVGCSLSHYKAWEQLRTSTAPAMIVFEDDAPIPVDLRARIDRMLATLPTDWDIVPFQCSGFGGGAVGCEPIQGEAPWEECYRLSGTHAYMVSRRGAERLLERGYPIEVHLDAYMTFMSRLKHVRMVWHPALQIDANMEDSDITHGSGRILDVPTNMEKEGVFAINTLALIGLVGLAAVVGGLVSLAYVFKQR